MPPAVPHSLREWARTADIPTIVDMFERSVLLHGDRKMLAARRDGAYQALTYREVAGKVADLAGGLVVVGLRAGDRVAQWSPNRPEWVISDLAIMSAGAVHVPLYPTLSPEQVAYILRDSGARVVIVPDRAALASLRAVSGRFPDLERVVVYDEREASFPDDTGGQPLVACTLEGVQRAGAEHGAEARGELRRRKAALEATTLASLVYTSGTTGEPKGAMLAHGNFLSNVTSVLSCMEVGPSDLELSFLPLCHVFERMIYYMLVTAGGQVAYAESVERVGANLAEVRPTLLPSVPRLFEKLHDRIVDGIARAPRAKRELFEWALGVGRAMLRHREAGKRPTVALVLAHRLADRLVFRKIRERMGGRIRYFISGGAPLDPEIGAFFHAVGLSVIEGYGLTETSPVISFNRPERFRLGTVGQAIPGVEVRVAGEDGEILCRGPNVMLGYHQRPGETREVLEEDGWFHTGDIGALDEDGFLTITDRKKDILVMSNGKKVAPQPIENLLKSSPFIEQAMVVGDNRHFITALVYPCYEKLEDWARGEGLTARGTELAGEVRALAFLQSTIDELCRHLAGFEKVKKIAVLEQEMSPQSGELTATLKYRRQVVLERHRAEIDRLYGESGG